MQYTGSVSYKDISDKNFLTVDNLNSQKISDIINELNSHNAAYSAQYDSTKITITSEKPDADNIRKIVDSVLAQPQQEAAQNKADVDNARSDAALEELRQQILQMQENQQQFISQMKEKQDSEHSVTPVQQENRITQVQPEYHCLLPVISSKVLKQEQKLDNLNERRSIRIDRIEDYRSRAEALTAKAQKLNATNQMLSELSKKALPTAVRSSVLALIKNNENRLEKIHNQKLPKLELKINNQNKKIESLDKRINLAQAKINRYQSLNNVISSFLHGDTEKFSQSLDELHNNTVALLNAKIDVRTDNIIQMTKAYKSNPVAATAAGIPLELTKQKRQRDTLIRKRNKLIGVIIPYVSQTEKVQEEVFTQVKNVVDDMAKQDNISPAEFADIVVEKPIDVIPQHVIITPPPSNDIPLLLPEIATIMDTSVSELESKPKDIQELLVLDYTNNFASTPEEIQEKLTRITNPDVRTEEHIDERRQAAAGLVSAEINGEIFNFKLYEQITAVQALEAIANSDKPFMTLKEISTQIDSAKAAEFEQSDKCCFSITADMHKKTATLYEINGGKGGIPEGKRTDNNVSFSHISLSDNPLKTVEELVEGNANMIDGIINNEPPKKEDVQKETKKKGFVFSRKQLHENARNVSAHNDRPDNDRTHKPPHPSI